MAPEHVAKRQAWRAVMRYAPRHRRLFLLGLGLTLLVVAAQLSLPWPLKELLRGSEAATWRGSLPAGVSPFLAMGALFLFLMSAAGYFDYVQRVAFARFAIGWSRDLRAAANVAAKSPTLGVEGLHPGDLVARLIGDVARFKASLKVTLVYVATNFILFLAGCAVIWWIHAPFGMIFTFSFVLALVVAGFGARRSFRDFAGYRHQEGLLATSLSGSGEMGSDELTTSSILEVSEVRQQSGVAWIAHGIVGGMVAAILLLGARGVQRGTLDPGVLLLFLGYALFLSKPLVRLTRHGARLGKLVASGLRLGSFLVASESTRASETTRPERRIEVRVANGKGATQELVLPAVGVVVVIGSRATPWVAALLGAEVDGAQVMWDTVPADRATRLHGTKCVSGRPAWTCASLEELVESLVGGPFEESLAGLGVLELAKARTGLAVAANEVSRAESVGVALALAAAHAPCIFVLDQVRESLDAEGEAALLSWMSAAAKLSLVVVCTTETAWLPADGVILIEGDL